MYSGYTDCDQMNTPVIHEHGRHRYPKRSFWLGVAVLKQKPGLGALIEGDVQHILGC